MFNLKTNKIACYIISKVLERSFQTTTVQIALSKDGMFCYDFIAKKNISTNDFKKIENDFAGFVAKSHNIKIQECDVKEIQKKINNKYLQEKLQSCSVSKVAVVLLDDEICDLNIFDDDELENIDLSDAKIIHLESIGGAYWKNQDKIVSTQRLYGFAAKDDKELKEHEDMLKEQRSCDHRKIAQDMELYRFDKLVGAGMPLLLPKGTVLKNQIENFLHDWLVFREYQFVQTPVLGCVEMYKISGHWDNYRENMYPPIKLDNEQLCLRPMTCPHHLLVYSSKPRSYRELPYRLAEHAILHRYEASGGLTGLERVRTMQLIDTHVLITPQQIKDEIRYCFDTVMHCHDIFGTKIHSIELSLHDPKNKEKFFDDPAMWKSAEEQLEQCMVDLGIPYIKKIGEAAFYGPKIDIQIKTALGRIITVSTIQLDFLLPKRFELTYIDSNGKQNRPVLIHGGIIGTVERFISILLEQTHGVFPIWLTPVQVQIIPVATKKQYDYACQIKKIFLQNKIRVHLDNNYEERLAKKIREAQVAKVPYQIIIGDNEIKSNKITYRCYGENKTYETTVDDFIAMIQKRVAKYE